MSKTQRRAIKSLDLAIGAEKIGSNDECALAARTAGCLARKAGFELDQVWRSVPDMGAYSMTWNCIVDGWYDAA